MRLLQLLAFVGAVALCALLIGGLSVAHAIRSGFSARDEPTWFEARAARFARGLAMPSRRQQRTNPLVVTPAVLSTARGHWANHCATCHANDGSGQTPIGRNLYPKAPDMRAATTQNLTDGELYGVIQNGIRLSGMPAWGEPVDDDEETWALVAFIRHLPDASREEIEAMKALNPMSADELRERTEEAEFLRTGTQPTENHHH